MLRVGICVHVRVHMCVPRSMCVYARGRAEVIRGNSP